MGTTTRTRILQLLIGLLLLLAASSALAAAPLTCPQTIAASLNPLNDPKQFGRLNRGVPASVCAQVNAPPPVVNPAVKYTHKAVTFKNRSNSTCVSVTLTSASDVSASAYISSFVPTDITQNYLGDSGNRAFPGSPAMFSFDVPTLSDFVVVVTEGVDGAGGTYTLNVQGCGDVLVQSVTPNFGPALGGTNVTIKGAGFLSVPGNPLVHFGGPAGPLATGVVVVDEFTITAKTPAHAAGLVDVTVQNTNGTSGTLAGAFTYYDPITPAISLSSDVNPSVFGQSVTLLAHIDPTAPGAATGSVTFKEGATVLGVGALDAAGNASISVSTFTVGTHSLQATYPGDVLFKAGVSNTLPQVVGKADTVTTLISSSNPSVIGQAVTFTAAVAPGAGSATGNIVFTEGATTLATVPLDATAQAKFSTAALAVGTHAIVATYVGSSQFNGSTSAALDQVVNLTGTTLVLASSLNPSTFGASVTFTATVSSNGGGTPTGSVIFRDGATQIGGPVALNGAGKAPFATSLLAAGTHPITATYSGDATNAPASGSLSQVVGPAATTLALASSKNPSGPGDSVTLTASLTTAVAGTPSGTVTFKDGTSILGSAALVAKAASFTTTTLAVGTHPLTAEYGGDPSYTKATSAVLNQVVALESDGGVDAGLPDSGTAPPTDAGGPARPTPSPVADAGVAPASDGSADSGCGCRTTSAASGYGSFATLLGVVALLTRIRRRRGR